MCSRKEGSWPNQKQTCSILGEKKNSTADGSEMPAFTNGYGLHTSPEILVEQNFPVISEVKKIYKEIPRDFLVTIFPPTKGKPAFFLGPPVTSGGQHVCDQLRRDWSQAAWRWVGMFGMVQRCYR